MRQELSQDPLREVDSSAVFCLSDGPGLKGHAGSPVYALAFSLRRTSLYSNTAASGQKHLTDSILFNQKSHLHRFCSQWHNEVPER
jgi:hypothetical protein